MKMDFETSLGMCMWLLSQSEYHKKWNLMTFDTEITAAVLHGQCKIYFDGEGNPVGLATWAWIDEERKQRLLRNEAPLSYDEWSCGDQLIFNDYIAPWGHAKSILKDLRTQVFPHETAFSLGRNADGSIRKVYKWKGIAVKDKLLTN